MGDAHLTTWLQNSGSGMVTTTEPQGTDIEARLTALEQEMAALRKRFATPDVPPNWMHKVTGAMKGRPEFLEMVEYGRQYRDSLPYSDEDPEAW